MTMTPAEIDALGAAGAAALNRGDHAAARAAFQDAADAGAREVAVWLGLALACLGQGDAAAADAAAGQALALQPENLRGLLIRADALAARGLKRAAVGFYAAVVERAGDLRGAPPAVAAEIRRAEAEKRRLSEDLEGFIRAHLEAKGLDPERDSARFALSLDIAMGRKKRYEQEPRSYYLPELPAVAFFDRAHFPWMAALEAETPAIRAELAPLLTEDGWFSPYIEAEAERAALRPETVDERLLDRDDWSACYLVRDGAPQPAAARCPRTMAALAPIPMEDTPGRAPFVLFSRLTPGAWIEPHTGYVNARLVVHLPLVVPEGCWFRVGSEVRLWEEGRAWAFDDTIEHEARNQGQGVRTILIFNVWRPDVTQAERRLIAGMFEAIDRYGAA